MAGLGILWTIIIGCAAGAIAGWIMKGKGFGFFINILLGLIGSIVGGWAYGLLGLTASTGKWGTLVMSTIGAIILIFIVSLFKKKK